MYKFLKALSPIAVTEAGILRLVRFSAFAKAPLSIVVNVSGKLIDVAFVNPKKTC